MKPSILTAKGQYFDFRDLSSNVIDIDTIAHALSHICRFSGHTRSFYSVAQHSILVAHSGLVAERHRFAALMHDAAEAFLGDVPTPLKAILPDYKALEHDVERRVLGAFGITAIPDDVWSADYVVLATEVRDLMPHHGAHWPEIDRVRPLPARIVPWPPQTARERFLTEFEVLRPAHRAA